MKFYKKQSEDGNLHIILVEDDFTPIFHLSSPEDSIEYWITGFLKLFDLNNNYKYQVEQLLECCCRLALPDPPVWAEKGFTFLRMLCGLTRAIDAVEKYRSEKKRKKQDFNFIKDSRLNKCRDKIKKLLEENLIFNFKIFFNGDEQMLSGGFMIYGKPHTLKYEKDRVEYIPMEWWSVFLEKDQEKEESLPILLAHFDLLEEILLNQERPAGLPEEHLNLLHSFGCFCQALVRFLDNDRSGDYIYFRDRVIPRLCAFIVKDEFFDFEEQKHYLDRILKSRNLSEKEKFTILEKIVIDVQEDYKKARKGGK